MKNKKILFSGYYGFSNLGDDMFGLVSTWGAKQYWKNSSTKLLSSQGPTDRKINIKLALTKKKYFEGRMLLQNYFEILKTNFIILSGGSILHSKTPAFSARGFAYMLSKIKLISMGGIGVSVGPFKNEEDHRFIESVLQSFKFLVVRDRSSYNIVSKMDLPYTPILGADLAFLLPKLEKLEKRKRENETKIIGISLCHYERYIGRNTDNEKRREDAIYEVLNELKKDNTIKFRFFVINGNEQTGDFDLSKSMIEKLSFEEYQYELIMYNSNTLKVYNLIGECDLMYSTRLHGAIFAAAANVPALLIEYHKKCMDYLDDIGVDAQWRVGDMDKTTNNVVKTITELLKNPPNDFYTNRDELLDRAKRNFTDEQITGEIS